MLRTSSRTKLRQAYVLSEHKACVAIHVVEDCFPNLKL